MWCHMMSCDSCDDVMDCDVTWVMWCLWCHTVSHGTSRQRWDFTCLRKKVLSSAMFSTMTCMPLVSFAMAWSRSISQAPQPTQAIGTGWGRPHSRQPTGPNPMAAAITFFLAWEGRWDTIFFKASELHSARQKTLHTSCVRVKCRSLIGWISQGITRSQQWCSEGRAWLGTCPAKAPCSSRSCHAISWEAHASAELMG